MNKREIVGRAIALSAAIFCGVNRPLSRLACATGDTPVSLTWIVLGEQLSPGRISGIAPLPSHWRAARGLVYLMRPRFDTPALMTRRPGQVWRRDSAGRS